MHDYLIVGAGLTGCVLAERIATQLDRRVLIIEQRDHIGGLAYDYYDEHGILVAKYGTHVFYSNSQKVVDYLSQFTEWHPYKPTAKVYYNGRLLPFPVNAETINLLYGTNVKSEREFEEFWNGRCERVNSPATLEEAFLSQVGRDVYEKLFRGYTRKYWQRDPRELERKFVYNLTTRMNRDHYVANRYQGLPKNGFTAMCKKMLDHRNITVLLNRKHTDVAGSVKFNRLIFTGYLGDFFDHCHGAVQFRTCRFEYETLDQEFFQPCLQVNYPNDFGFKRIIEYKHATGQKHAKTTIAREYAADAENGSEMYYPVPTTENWQRFQNYRKEASKLNSVIFCGRLSNFRYYPMDVAVARALKVFEDAMACS